MSTKPLIQEAVIYVVVAVIGGAILWIVVLQANNVAETRHRERANASAQPKRVIDDSGPMIVQVTGKNFEWHFRFPSEDGKLGTADDLVSRKDLRLPVGTDVRLHLNSEDYIYTFTLSELNIREIAVPELTYTVDLRATEIGTFELLADPLCGYRFLHDDQMGRVMILSRTDFDRWKRSVR